MTTKVFSLLAFIVILLALSIALLPAKKVAPVKNECCKNVDKNCKEVDAQPADNMIFEPISRQFIVIPISL